MNMDNRPERNGETALGPSEVLIAGITWDGAITSTPDWKY